MKTILIVDDDSDDRELFCEALGEAMPDFRCEEAGNGRKALTALENGTIELPDLIFLDINMPLMNGWQTLTRLKELEHCRHIPVIAYSTSSYKEDIEKARRLGALCFLPKSPDFKALKKILHLVAEHLKEGTLSSLLHADVLC